MTDKNITQVSQLKAETTEALNQYAGALGQFVYDKSTSHMHIMKGQAGQHIKMANYDDLGSFGYSKSEADGKYQTKADMSKYATTEALNGKLGKNENAVSATKATQDANGDVIHNTYAKKTDISAVFKFKGTKPNQSALPGEGNATGDVWHIEDSQKEYVWNGTAWEELGTSVDVSGFLSKAEASNLYLGKTAKAESAKVADTATKATQDAQGRVIVETYLTKAEGTAQYQPKGEYLTAESTIDYSKITNIPKVIDYGTLTVGA